MSDKAPLFNISIFCVRFSKQRGCTEHMGSEMTSILKVTISSMPDRYELGNVV
jgi:hypothetical protein